MPKTKDMALLSFVLNFFHRVFIGKKEKVLLTPTVGKLHYLCYICRVQGGRTWQAFGGGKHGHETFRQARNYNFRDKCVSFARNLKFSNLTQ